MKLIVVKLNDRVGDNSDFVEIDINEVNYFDLWKKDSNSDKVLAFHTSEGSFLALSTLKEAHSAYCEYGFELYDRSTGVNTQRVKEAKQHKSGSIVEFHDGSTVIVRKKIY
ncbi:LytTR family transcriptional regulator DNA-binding domain-containing protein [Paenibacillus sp. FSL H7-0690]|uniref:LytTR family transcriptional regulator DNA-binding domain-containing protein n=1 Tax=Paenibacillus sp. FSL H7-0690 TaxID=2921437 RepID=UPI0030EC87D7